jgi:methionyl-tRNA formyltransferase
MRMNISLLCTGKDHPIYPRLQDWVSSNAENHNVELVSDANSLSGGDLLFLVSCSDIVNRSVRGLYRKALVIHASDLPLGRGWSPHIWQIIEGKTCIVVALLEADDPVDSGAVWTKSHFSLEGDELWDEINDKLFSVELELMDYAVANYHSVSPTPQSNSEASYYPRREPKDSQIDPRITIEEQFDLLRTCDPIRYPAYFYLRGCKYKVILQKCGEQVTD